MNIKSKFTSKAFKSGSYSVFASIIVIAIAIAVVMLVKALPSSYTKYDWSRQQLFTLSEQTKQIASGLTQDVEIYLLIQSGTEDATIVELLDRYDGLSDKIHVTHKDVVQYPNFVKQYDYTADEIYNNSILVTCGDRNKFVSYTDMYVSEYDYYSGTSSDPEFYGESAITSAIGYVTSENLPKVYTLTGHGEQSLSENMISLIEKENIDVEDLELLSQGSVPQDAKCLIIIAPTKDISQNERDVILEYLKNGGRLLLTTDYSKASFTNLSSVMEYYGVQAQNGMIFEGKSSYSLTNYIWYLLPDLNSHEITDPIIKNKYNLLVPVAHAIKTMAEARESLEITSLLETSKSAYLKEQLEAETETHTKSDSDIQGPFSLAVAIAEKSGQEQEIETRIVWIASSLFLDNSVDQFVSGTNGDFFVNSIGWMCEIENSITIRPKSMAYEYLTISKSASTVWITILVAVIPLAFIATGIIVSVRRKSR